MKMLTDLSAMLALVIIFTGACATLPPQVRPASPELFMGQWEGNWQRYGGPSGSVDLTIEPKGNDVQLYVKYTNAVVPGFEAEAKFVSGELVVNDHPVLSLVVRLHGNDRLEASYRIKRDNAQGGWSLVRRKDKGTAEKLTTPVVIAETEKDLITDPRIIW